jgi:hypothetical protein
VTRPTLIATMLCGIREQFVPSFRMDGGRIPMVITHNARRAN